MKITKSEIKKIVKEELRIIKENSSYGLTSLIVDAIQEGELEKAHDLTVKNAERFSLAHLSDIYLDFKAALEEEPTLDGSSFLDSISDLLFTKINDSELSPRLKKELTRRLNNKTFSGFDYLNEGASSLEKDVLPGSTDIDKLAEEVDKFIFDTADKAKELIEKLNEEMKVDMLGGKNPSMAPRVGERNRMLQTRIGVLRKIANNLVNVFEYIRREG